MAAFSYQFLDSVFLQEGNMNTNSFSQFYPPESVIQGVQFDVTTTRFSDNEPSSVTKKQSTDSSTMVDDALESGEQVTQKITSLIKKRKISNGFSSNSAHSKVASEGKGKKQKKGNNGVKIEEKKTKVDKKNQKKVNEEPPTGYIHVRARRGQATDSHSLAERVRREKISERMKTLQHLVPGCDKVTGKALMLDEIINYVQSLQNQVEFLSMKLASSNPMLYDFGADFDELLIRPERLTDLVSPLPSLPQCSPTTAAGTITTTNFISPDNGNIIWDVEYQRQKFMSPSGLNLCSFH